MAWLDVLSIFGARNTTSGVSEQVDKTDDARNALHVKTEFPNAVTPYHVQATASGTTLVINPASGKSIRLWWYNLGASPNNSAAVLAGLRFTSGGDDFHRHNLSQYGASAAHSFKAGQSYHQGGVDEGLYVNLSAAQTVEVNIDFENV